MSVLVTIGQRQKSLLKLLLHSPAGLTVDELSKALEISRNAVKQHLVSLKGNDFIESSTMSSTGGRPSKVYALTTEGKELFPRHYDLFTNLLMRLLKEKIGENTLKSYLVELGNQLASEFEGQMHDKDSLADRVSELTSIMYDLGYEAKAELGQDGLYEIVASNCVFHKLATENNSVCDLDLSLISALLKNVNIEHKECMVKGGSCCRFTVLAQS
ncbi:MAG: HTH domain-containing protein [Sulfuriflexus sp.]|nr:HTH domain-containing protein [Sulfuriflexus sp.]